MKALPLRYRENVTKVAYASDDRVDRRYVSDSSIPAVGPGPEAGCRREVEADYPESSLCSRTSFAGLPTHDLP